MEFKGSDPEKTWYSFIHKKIANILKAAKDKHTIYHAPARAWNTYCLYLTSGVVIIPYLPPMLFTFVNIAKCVNNL